MPLGAAKAVYQGYQPAAGSSVARETALTVSVLNDAVFDRDQYNFDRSSGYFDGVGDVVYATTDYNFPDNDWTFEMWFRGTATLNKHMASLSTTTHRAGLTLYYASTTVTVYSGNDSGGWAWATALTGFNAAGNWNHIAITKEGNTVKGFVNGGSPVTLRSSAWNMNDVTLIAAGAAQNSGSWETWQGHIDEMRISNNVRYTTSFTPSTTPFVNDDNTLYLQHFDGFDGDNDFYDDAGVRTYVTPDRLYDGGLGPPQYDTAQKKFGSSSWYNRNDYNGLQMHNEAYWSDAVGTGAFTVEMWVRRETKSDSTDYWLVDAHNNQFELYYDISANSLKFATEGVDRITGGSLNTGTWYHIAVTRDSSNNTKLFINGTQSGSTSTANDRNWANIQYWFMFCKNSGDSTFTGHIDEMRISDVARYTSNFTAPSAAFTNDDDTLLLYHFEGTDATSGSIIDDNT
jgi:hypothetical protein